MAQFNSFLLTFISYLQDFFKILSKVPTGRYFSSQYLEYQYCCRENCHLSHKKSPTHLVNIFNSFCLTFINYLQDFSTIWKLPTGRYFCITFLQSREISYVCPYKQKNRHKICRITCSITTIFITRLTGHIFPNKIVICQKMDMKMFIFFWFFFSFWNHKILAMDFT